MRESTSALSYDKLEFLFVILGLFHVQINYGRMIHLIHWGKDELPHEQLDRSTLRYACAMLNRPQASNGKVFQVFEELTLDTFDGVVIAIFIHLVRNDLSTQAGDFVSKKDFENWLHGQGISQISFWIDKIHEDIFKSDLTILGPEFDDEWANHRLFVRHMLPYQLLDYAISHGDLRLLRESLRQTCIIFQAPSAHKNSYARELIRFVDLVDGDIAEKPFADALLRTALVNIQGRPDSFYPTDQHLEHLNLSIRIGLNQSRSSHEKSTWITNHVLNIRFFQELGNILNRELGINPSSRHTPKAKADDIFVYAARLAKKSVIYSGDRVRNEVPNLKAEGHRAYPDACMAYNRRLRRQFEDEDDNVDDNPFEDELLSADDIQLPRNEDGNPLIMENDGLTWDPRRRRATRRRRVA